MKHKQIYHANHDAYWGHPVIDIEEHRERTLPDGKRLPYTYVHGYFRDTGINGIDVKFSLAFPVKSEYRGRFFQHLSPFPGSDGENSYFQEQGLDDHIAFALTHGAYFVASNMGAGPQMGGTTNDATFMFKSSAAVAEYSRMVAKRLYATQARAYGYVYGASGGGFKTMSCLENTDAWDGGVPHVIGSPVAIPNCMCIPSLAKRVLRHHIDTIVDAQEPGGSGDLYQGLSTVEKDVLTEATALGFPTRTWFMMQEGFMDDGSLVVLAPGVKAMDPHYFEDFWTVPGYAGHDREVTAVQDRVQLTTTIQQITRATELDSKHKGSHGANDAFLKELGEGSGAEIELAEGLTNPDVYLMGLDFTILSGAARGTTLAIKQFSGKRVQLGATYGVPNVDEILTKLRPGDQIRIDNSDYIALQHYYRYQDLGDDFPTYRYLNQKYPNRPRRPIPPIGEPFTYSGAGSVQDGDIQAKTIVVECAMDEFASPWQADWYQKKVNVQLQARGLDPHDHFRLWVVDHSLHNDSQYDMGVHTINYYGVVHRALLAVSDWVERGITPAASTRYQLDNAQLQLPKLASERKGIQPTVDLSVNNRKTVHIQAGAQVSFEAQIQTTADEEQVVCVQWNFDGQALTTYGDRQKPAAYRDSDTEVMPMQPGLTVATTTHRYDQSGQYFATIKVGVNPQNGENRDRFIDVLNIDRVRVVVN